MVQPPTGPSTRSRRMMARFLMADVSVRLASAQACVPADSFTPIDFGVARLARTNLGGLGGRCDVDREPELCTEGGRTVTTPNDVYIMDVGNQSGVAFDVCAHRRRTAALRRSNSRSNSMCASCDLS
jgi:hypothetical protein